MTAVLCVGHRCLDRSGAARTPSPGLRLCAGCRRAVRTDLAELPGLYADCESALVPRRGPAGPRVSGGGHSVGIALDDEAVAARTAVQELLGSWAALVADERPVRRPNRRDPAGLAAYLLTHLDWLLAHPAAGDFAEELARTADRARRPANTAPGTLRLDLGECVLPDCSATMTTAPSRGGPRSVEVRCGAGHSWPPHQWLRLFHRQRADDRRTG